jgi:hypothetical protein
MPLASALPICAIPPLLWKEFVSPNAVFWAAHHESVSWTHDERRVCEDAYKKRTELPETPEIVLWEFGMTLPP